jgi:hypothetical protein
VPVYPGVYQAKSTKIGRNGVEALIPQVFGEAPVAISRFMGSIPAKVGIGWVIFIAGNPEYPVWCSGASITNVTTDESGESIFITRDYRWSNAITAADPGDGRVKVNNLDPALATEVYISSYDMGGSAYITLLSLTTGDLFAVYLSGDVSTRIEYTLLGPPVNNAGWLTIPVAVSSNLGFHVGEPGNNVAVKVTIQTVSGGTTGAGEVWIGPSAPTDPGVELWYDTDAPTPAIIPEPWTNLPLLNSWGNEGGTIQIAQYRRVGDLVTLRGTATKTASSPADVLFILPAGFRPPANQRYSLGVHQANVGGIYAARFDIDSAGSGLLTNYTSPGVTNPVVYFNQISFSVTA